MDMLAHPFTRRISALVHIMLTKHKNINAGEIILPDSDETIKLDLGVLGIRISVGKICKNTTLSQPEMQFLQFKPNNPNLKNTEAEECCYFTNSCLSQPIFSTNPLKRSWKPPIKVLNEKVLEPNKNTYEKYQENTKDLDKDLPCSDSKVNTFNGREKIDHSNLATHENFSAAEFKEKLNLGENKENFISFSEVTRSSEKNCASNDICDMGLQNNIVHVGLEHSNKQIHRKTEQICVFETISSKNEQINDSLIMNLEEDESEHIKTNKKEEEEICKADNIFSSKGEEVKEQENQNIFDNRALEAEQIDKNVNCSFNQHDDIINSIDMILSEGQNNQESQDDQMLIDSVFENSSSSETTNNVENVNIELNFTSLKKNFENNEEESKMKKKNVLEDVSFERNVLPEAGTSLNNKEDMGKKITSAMSENVKKIEDGMRGCVEVLDDECSGFMLSTSQLLEIEKKYYEIPHHQSSVMPVSRKLVSVSTQTEPQTIVVPSVQYSKGAEETRRKLLDIVQEITRLNSILLKARQEIRPQRHLSAETLSSGFTSMDKSNKKQ